MRVLENDQVSAVALVVAGDDSNAEEEAGPDDEEYPGEEPEGT